MHWKNILKIKAKKKILRTRIDNSNLRLRGDNMGKLSILRGNSGSGKSTIAKALQNKFGQNTMLISQDEIRRILLKTFMILF